jgi:hypothetical protein
LLASYDAHAQPAPQPPKTPPLTAQQEDFAMKATVQTHLAYIITGDPTVDDVSKAGLQGLTLFLAQRTALEAGDPVGLDPARDELAFFPLIYWPVSPSAPKPSQAALEKIDAYMKRGGTVLFDTRDADARARHGRTPFDPVLARHSRVGAGAARSRAHQNLFPPA